MQLQWWAKGSFAVGTVDPDTLLQAGIEIWKYRENTNPSSCGSSSMRVVQTIARYDHVAGS